uniref:CSON000996 protein n=1 Tax=Culicoides sonorensis TaxID=179676 RepID=A0A336MJN6_CULSO
MKIVLSLLGVLLTLLQTSNARASVPWPINCNSPKCNTEEFRNVLWPSKVPRNYYFCLQDGNNYIPMTKRCEDSILSHFDYFKQKCVRANEWKNPCNGGPRPPPGSSEETSADSSTTSTPTTSTTPSTTTSTKKPGSSEEASNSGSHSGSSSLEETSAESSTSSPSTTTSTKKPGSSEEGSNSGSGEATSENPVTSEPTTTESSNSSEETTTENSNSSKETTTENSNSSEESGESTVTQSTTTSDPGPSVPWPITCNIPKCNIKEYRNIKWPTKVSRNYYICLQDGDNYIPMMKRCEDSILSHFDYFRQECVRANEWNNPCNGGTKPPPPTTTTTTTTEIVTTTTEEITSEASSSTEEPTTEATSTTAESTTTPSTTQSTTTPSTTQSTTTPSTTQSTTTQSTTTQAPGLPWPVDCDKPKCDTEANRKTLWPGKTPRDYYECNGNVAVKKRCEDNQLSHFQYLSQKCVRANEWNNSCKSFKIYV